MTATGDAMKHASPLIAACIWIVVLAGRAAGQAYFIPGDPKSGMQVFFEKGCAKCHAVLGEGGRSAPDLARAPAGLLSAADLVAAMWNHAPVMWAKMRLEKLAPPKFSEPEMTNLFAFLYSVRSLDEPGDADRGRKLLAEKRCLDCHAIAGQGTRAGRDLRAWASYRNPVSWVQAMWNHGAPMQAMMGQRGFAWPEFRDNEMADLIASVRSLASNPKARAQLRRADASAGREVFRAKGCATCHSIRGAGGRGGPDLGGRALPRTLGQLAGLLWNHAPKMWETMRAQGVTRPQFSNQEMADLIAYLFTERYFDPAGDAGRGQTVVHEKGCGACHGLGQGSGPAPSLARWQGAASPVPVATALWNHGPLMLERIERRHLEWPRFRAGEMRDLMEYLNRGAPPAELRARAGGKP